MQKPTSLANPHRWLMAAQLVLAVGVLAAPTTSWKFNFGAVAKSGFVTVSPGAKYSGANGYGFDFGSEQVVQHNASKEGVQGVRSGKNAHNWAGLPFYAPAHSAFFFSVALPRGNYEVKITMGDRDSAVRSTVRAEQRRLMIEDWPIAAGQSQTKILHVHRRSDTIAGTKTRISLTTREKSYIDLDDRLSLEFNGNHPVLQTLEISPVDTDITVHLCGNSTVVDQPQEPWSTWGMNITRFFKPGVSVANHAESGLSASSFLGGRRLDNVLASLKPGDYVFVEFGHNDEKAYDAAAYKDYLSKFVNQVKAKGGLPVIVSPTARMSFSGQKAANTHGAFPDSARSLAAQQKVPFFDMTAMSTKFIEALGPSNASKAYAYFAANTVPDQTSAIKDGTHWNGYGGYELAKAMAAELKRQKLGLAEYLVDDFAGFDPSVPDPYASFKHPFSPFLGQFEAPDSAVAARRPLLPSRIGEHRIRELTLRHGLLEVRFDGPAEGLEVRLVRFDGSLPVLRMQPGSSNVLRARVVDGRSHGIEVVELVRDGIVLDRIRVVM